MTTNNTAAPRLQVKGIRKTFGQNAVLKGIDLSVDAGEVVALIGGNGAGKSTLMKIIMGIYTCDEGEVLIDGKAVKLGKPSASLAIMAMRSWEVGAMREMRSIPCSRNAGANSSFSSKGTSGRMRPSIPTSAARFANRSMP